MKYGKLENGYTIEFLSINLDNGGVIYAPTHDQFIENGYFPIIENRPEEKEGFYIETSYSLIDNQIIASYEFKKVEVSDEYV